MPLVQPGNYNIDYNQTLPIMKFQRFGGLQMSMSTAWNLIFMAIFLILIYIAVKAVICWIEQLRDEQEVIDVRSFERNMQKLVDKFIAVCRCMEDEFAVLGEHSQRRDAYEKDMLRAYRPLIGLEDFIILRNPHVEKY